MGTLGVISGFLFIVMGIAGGMTAISRFWRGYSGIKLLHPFWGAYFGLALLFSGFFMVRVMNAYGQLSLFYMACMPFALFGAILWCCAFVFEILHRGMAPKSLRVERTFDIAEGLMVRGRFTEAEGEYRRHMVEEPSNLVALLGACRAMTAAGRAAEAAKELESALRRTLDNDPSQQPEMELEEKAEFRQRRILRIVFALGDLYVEQLNDGTRACNLYRETLEVLFGYPDADPLRSRLKALEEPGRLPMPDAVEQAQPRTMRLE